MKPKHLPRLWCALQGLLPLETRPVAQSGELASPSDPARKADAPISPEGDEPISGIDGAVRKEERFPKRTWHARLVGG